MLDISAKIKTILNDNWLEDNPALQDFIWKFDEFDPKWGKESGEPKTSLIAQVLFENFPDRKIFVTKTAVGNCYRVEHGCRMTIYLKPIRYDDTTIEAAKVSFFNLKTEIDRILAQYKFLISEISNLEMSMGGWNDRESIARGRGIKQRVEPIIFTSEKIVHAVYYIIG